MTDITEHKQAEVAVKKHQKLESEISKLLKGYVSKGNSIDVFDNMLGILLGITKSEYGFIGEVLYNSDNSPYLKLYSITNIEWGDEIRKFYEGNMPIGMKFRNLTTLFGKVMTTQDYVISNDQKKDTEAGGIPKGQPPLDSFLGIPLKKEGKLVGMIGMVNCKEGYDSSIVNYLEPLIEVCANILMLIKADQDLVNSEEHNRLLLDSTAEAIYELDLNGNCTFCNSASLRMLGYEKKQDLLGKNMHKLIHHTRVDGSPYPVEDSQINIAFIMNKKSHIDTEVLFRKDGSFFPVEYWSHPINREGKTLGCVVTFLDITMRNRADELLNYQANYDNLTGLVNRTEFERCVERLLVTVRQDKREHALCFMDLDQFKVVNDTCGHTAGDEMLRQLSSVLKETVRYGDILARMGGDEFGILMENCSLDAARRVTISLKKAVQDYQFLWKGHHFKVGVSMGLVSITETTVNLTELLSDADLACYMAKEKGRNRIHVYNAEDSEIAQRYGEMQWVTRINQALEENRFCLYAQPIVSLNSNTDKHYELLIRMIVENGETIPPGAFLPAAERYNLISKLDHWVIENAFNFLADNNDFLKQINFCSINLSGQSITNSDILEFIINKLESSGVQSEKICFEITETAVISNLSSAIKFISTLRELGCRFALDDFGSGLSSFAYLKNLPVDYLKIDGMFVKGIVEDRIDYAMVKSINEIGHVMEMKTIAEFVENDEIKDMLLEIGVDYGQGYGIAKPLPLDEFLDG